MRDAAESTKHDWTLCMSKRFSVKLDLMGELVKDNVNFAGRDAVFQFFSKRLDGTSLPPTIPHPDSDTPVNDTLWFGPTIWLRMALRSHADLLHASHMVLQRAFTYKGVVVVCTEKTGKEERVRVLDASQNAHQCKYVAVEIYPPEAQLYPSHPPLTPQHPPLHPLSPHRPSVMPHERIVSGSQLHPGQAFFSLYLGGGVACGCVLFALLARCLRYRTSSATKQAHLRVKRRRKRPKSSEGHVDGREVPLQDGIEQHQVSLHESAGQHVLPAQDDAGIATGRADPPAPQLATWIQHTALGIAVAVVAIYAWALAANLQGVMWVSHLLTGPVLQLALLILCDREEQLYSLRNEVIGCALWMFFSASNLAAVPIALASSTTRTEMSVRCGHHLVCSFVFALVATLVHLKQETHTTALNYICVSYGISISFCNSVLFVYGASESIPAFMITNPEHLLYMNVVGVWYIFFGLAFTHSRRSATRGWLLRLAEAFALTATKEVQAAHADKPAFQPRECPVCLEESEDYFVTDCGHIFCAACIGHAKAQGVCPMCRQNVEWSTKIYL